MQSSLSDDQNSNDAGDFIYNDANLILNSMDDIKIAQLAAAGPTGKAAAAAITSCHKGKNNYEFETNPAFRKRLQTRLLKKLKATLIEYSVRVGQQAAIILYKPSKPPTTNSLKIFGSQPLEDVLSNWSLALITDLEKTFSSNPNLHTPQNQNQPTLQHQYELPPLVIDGIPTCLDKMTQGQLRGFIPHMLKFATGRGKPGWGRQNMTPIWWPKHIPWANVRADIRTEEQKLKMSWTEALKEIIRNCYAYYGRLDLIDTATDQSNHGASLLNPNCIYSSGGVGGGHLHLPRTPNSSTSYLDSTTAESDFSMLAGSGVANIMDHGLGSPGGPDDYLLNHNGLMSPNPCISSTYHLFGRDTPYVSLPSHCASRRAHEELTRLTNLSNDPSFSENGKLVCHSNKKTMSTSEDLILDLSSLNRSNSNSFYLVKDDRLANHCKRLKKDALFNKLNESDVISPSLLQDRDTTVIIPTALPVPNGGEHLIVPKVCLDKRLPSNPLTSGVPYGFSDDYLTPPTNPGIKVGKDKMCDGSILLNKAKDFLHQNLNAMNDKFKADQPSTNKCVTSNPEGSALRYKQPRLPSTFMDEYTTTTKSSDKQRPKSVDNVDEHRKAPYSSSADSANLKFNLISPSQCHQGLNEQPNMAVVIKVQAIYNTDGTFSLLPFTITNNITTGNDEEDDDLNYTLYSPNGSPSRGPNEYVMMDVGPTGLPPPKTGDLSATPFGVVSTRQDNFLNFDFETSKLMSPQEDDKTDASHYQSNGANEVIFNNLILVDGEVKPYDTTNGVSDRPSLLSYTRTQSPTTFMKDGNGPYDLQGLITYDMAGGARVKGEELIAQHQDSNRVVVMKEDLKCDEYIETV